MATVHRRPNRQVRRCHGMAVTERVSFFIPPYSRPLCNFHYKKKPLPQRRAGFPGSVKLWEGERVKSHFVRLTRQEPLGSLKNSHFAVQNRGSCGLPLYLVPARPGVFLSCLAADNPPVLQVEHPVRLGGNLVVVGDEHHAPAHLVGQAQQDVDDVLAVLRVQVARGLVR